jgi:hypothetical protein
LWKPNWACTTCGMLSSRHWSVKRHIMNLHRGNGLEVRYVDYMEGRLTGIYKSNDSKQQQKSSKYRTYFDTFYGATKRLVDASSSFFSSPYSNNYCLIAIKIPHKKKNNKIKNNEDNNDNIADNADDNNNDNNNNNNIQPEQETIKIPNPKNPKQQITFQYSKEKLVHLSLTSNENTKNHYAARAIIDGHTILTNDEMEDFMKMIQTSTFAVFKIRMPSSTTTSSSLPLQHQHHQHQQDESIGLYFLAIIPYDDTLYSQPYLPNKSNNNNNNNNKSVQSNSTDETFLNLCNHLANISNFTTPIVNSQPSLSLSSS